MAKKSVINRNLKRRRTVQKYLRRREELQKIFRTADSYASREQAFAVLQKLPRDACKVRVRNRCALTGRPRGVFRRFGIARGMLREMIMNGEIPGVIKSSW